MKQQRGCFASCYILTKEKYPLKEVRRPEHADWRVSTNIKSEPKAYRELSAIKDSDSETELEYEGFIFIAGGRYREDKILRACERYDLSTG